MAEALANHLGKGRLRALSAGTSPLGEIAPLTFQVLRDKGLDLEGHWSKGLEDVPVEKMDVVVGMGGEGRFPLPAGFKGLRIEWNIPDPFGHDAAYFRSVCDLVERQVKTLLHQIDEHHQTIEVVPPVADKNKSKDINRS
jgi:arsenate reductase